MRLQPEIFERNASALRVFQPEVAEILQDCGVPEGIIPTTGRDGEPTLLLPGTDGPVWLGGSSMPRASAEEMLGNAAIDYGSVTLPAMMTGMEAIVLARRLAPRFAVFVTDHEVAIKLALLVRDYESLLKNGRVVFLLSDDIPARARQFFSAHPGFAAPAHMFQMPQVEPGRLANLARSLEDAATEAGRAQHEHLADLVTKIRKGVSRSIRSLTRRVALLATYDSQNMEETANRYARAFSYLGLACSECLPTSSGKCHVVARIGEVVRHGADFAMYLGGVPAHERELFPDAFPVVDWLTHGRFHTSRASGRPLDFIVVENRSSMKQVMEVGWPQQKTLLLEPSVDCEEGPEAQVEGVGGSSSIRVFMSLLDDRPECVGITLPSQIELWRSLQKEVLRRADAYVPGNAPDLLRAAQSSSGTVFDDAPLIESFQGWLQTRIAPATIARSMAQALVKSGFRPEIWGEHWPPVGRREDLRRGPIPVGRQLDALMQDASWVVVPWFSHTGVALAMDAMARGGVVLMRGSREEFGEEYPGLADIADAIHWFRTAGEMIADLRKWTAQPEHAAERARVVARLIRDKHSLAARLQQLANSLDMARAGVATG